MSKRICFYGECMPIPGVVVRDEITKEPKERDPDVEAKLARVVALLEKLVEEDRPAETDVMAAKKQQRRENARRLRERNAKAKKYEDPEDRVTVPAEFLEKSDVVAARKKMYQENAKRMLEKSPEYRLNDALRKLEYEQRCRDAENAYSARNPHKAQQDEPQENRVQYPHKPRKRAPWEDRLATQDSASGFMIICEQVEAAYAARNPHKR